jgi:predicted metalloendopeptidase
LACRNARRLLTPSGKLVLGESIGDLAGAKIAYRAFQISQRGKPPLPTTIFGKRDMKAPLF